MISPLNCGGAPCKVFPLLINGDDEIRLAQRIEAGDEGAFNQMVEANLRLVANIARKCRRFRGQLRCKCRI